MDDALEERPAVRPSRREPAGPRLAAALLRHRRPVLGVWLLILVAGMAVTPAVNARISDDFAVPGSHGQAANAAIERTYGSGGADPLVPVITMPPGTRVETVRPRLARAFAAAEGRLRGRVVSYANTGDRRFVSADGRTTFGLVFADASGAQVTDALGPDLPPGATLRVTGIGPLGEHGADQRSTGHGVIELTLIGSLGALAVLAFVFGSLLALTPLLIALVSIFATFLAVRGLVLLAPVNVIVEYLVALIGLGVAIDYSLLLVTRWREEYHRGVTQEEAVRRAMATAGRAVLLSGSTVAVGLLSMVVLPVPFLRSIGYAGMLIPLISALVTVTLLPVILATAGRRLDWPRRRREATASRGWMAWARGVVRVRWAAAALAVAALAVLAFFAPQLRTGTAQSTALATSGSAYEGLASLRAGGVPSGVLTPMDVLVPAGVDPDAVAARLARVGGVRDAAAPAGPEWRRGGTALVAVLPAAEAGTRAGRTTIERVRTVAAAEWPGVRVGGNGVADVDFGRAVYGRFPLMLAVISAVTFVLLARAFRSLVLAAKAVAVDLLSIGAVLGAVVLIWQQGHGSQAIWGIPAMGAVDTLIPLLVFAFLFGLSMDYEVFLLARMRETYDRTGSTHQAVVEGIGRTGRLVTSAALILFLAFAALAASPQPIAKVFATGLGAGILLDATVVRSLLVPALVAGLGRWSWWLPGWAARLLIIAPGRPGTEERVASDDGAVLRGSHDGGGLG